MRPLITPLNYRYRFWKRASLVTLAGLLVFLLALPTLLTQLIRYQVPRMGLGQIEIGNIDLNLFRGKLLLEEVALYKSAARVLSLQHAEVDLSVLSLLEQRLHIESLSVNGLSLTVKQDEGQPLQVAGIPLSPATAEEPPPKATDELTPWAFGIDTMSLSDSSIQVIHPQFSELVLLDNLSLGALAMWRPEFITPLSLHLGVREGQLSVKTMSTPFASRGEHKVELNITSLPLEIFAGFAEPLLSEFKGELSTQIQVQLVQHGDRHLSVNQQGSLTLSNLRLHSGETMLVQREMHWAGSLDSADVTDVAALQVKGDLRLTDAGLLVAERKEPVFSLQGLSLNELMLDGDRQLSLGEVVVDSLKAELARTNRGILVAGLPDAGSKSDGQESESKEEPSVTTDGEAFVFSVERVLLSGNNRFTFDDQTVKPSFHHSLTLTEAEINRIDSSRPEQATEVMVKGKDDYYTSFTINGEAKPFAPQLDLDLKATLSGFDMPPASPYLAQLLGYRITTGQLESDVVMRIEKNIMKGEVDLRMNQLQLEEEEPARIEAFQSKTALPLNTALSLLRDKNDNIQLKLPISGNMDDPEFALDDIINIALGKALKAGSVSYLKHLLQPYGSLITVVQLAGDLIGQVQLEPVRFAAGSAELSPEAADYIGKISQLMTKKGINLRLCGFSSVADLTVISKGKKKLIPPAGHPVLEALAKQRAESVKSLLVHSYGIEAKQLFICHPELDRSDQAESRVELAI